MATLVSFMLHAFEILLLLLVGSRVDHLQTRLRELERKHGNA